jgi:hypothetical protein
MPTTRRNRVLRASGAKDAVEAAIDMTKEQRDTTWERLLGERPNRISKWEDTEAGEKTSDGSRSGKHSS